jgi:hypothetical protein
MAQKKEKKMENEVVVTEVKDVDFGDLELKLNKPTLNKDNTVAFSGNWDNLKGNIQKVVDKYKGTQLTEDNVEYVKTLKKQFVSLRTGVERECKEYKTVYIDPAEDLLNAMKKELLAVIAEGENALGAQLDEYDQRRKDELTVILKEYVDEAVEKHHLRDEYATQIQLIKQYYNKTQKEEDTIADIDRQAKELQEKQTAYDNGVVLIEAECEESGLLPDAYIRELAYRNAMEIIMEIKQDKKTQSELKTKEKEGEKIAIGADSDSEVAKQIAKATELTAKEDEKRTRILRVTYKASQAKLMARFFKENDIKFEFINSNF